MRLSNVKELFQALTQRYFAGASVVFAQQSRVAKPEIPLVTLNFGNVKRHWDAMQYNADGEPVAAYPSRVSVVVDLFTHGAPVKDDEGAVIAHEDTAMDDMLAYLDFLGSQFVIDWCNRNDLSVLVEGDVQDLTGVVNDNNYEFRSRLNLWIYFTHMTAGHAFVLDEDSIQYPTGEEDEEGEPIYSPVMPPVDSSTDEEPDPVIVPVVKPTPSGGGSEELARLETEYFTEVIIEEDKT